MVESNDRLNLQNDKAIEKLIPFELGIHYSVTFRTYPLFGEDQQSKQVGSEARTHFSAHCQVSHHISKKVYYFNLLSI